MTQFPALLDKDELWSLDDDLKQSPRNEAPNDEEWLFVAANILGLKDGSLSSAMLSSSATGLLPPPDPVLVC